MPQFLWPLAWWKRIGCGFQLLLISSLVIAACTAWWWIDSARSCEAQDEYNLRGICLLRIQERAEQGDSAAQWAYGHYLEAESKQAEAQFWQRKAMHGARTGLGLRDSMEAYCDRVPGFEARTVESTMLRVAENSPDAHLRLLQLYTYPGCGAFDLDKASAQIPRLTQCAYLAIARYLRTAEEKRYRVSPWVRVAIQSNMKRCDQELAHPPLLGTTVREIMPVRQQDLDDLARRLAALGP